MIDEQLQTQSAQSDIVIGHGDAVEMAVDGSQCKTGRASARGSIHCVVSLVKSTNITFWKVLWAFAALTIVFLSFYFLNKGLVDDDMEIVVTSSLKDDGSANADSSGGSGMEDSE